MSLFDIIAILITLSALFAYLNRRFIRMPTTIGIMLIAVVVSLFVVFAGRISLFNFGIEEHWHDVVRQIDFNKALMVGMLGFLLFAGALHVNLNELLKQKWEVALLATLGVLISTVIVGTLSYFVLYMLNLKTQLMDCMLFGALISPTDPIAVMSIVREAGVSKGIETTITGESLFNDGVGVVVFISLLNVVQGGEAVTAARLFAEEAVGGVILGLMLGWSGYAILKSVDDYTVEILVTLSLVTGGYSLARALHTSGPIAIVVAGLLIGGRGREFAMSEQTRRNIDTFWQLIDEILNSILFLLVGIELIVVTLRVEYVIAGLVSIPVVLISRFISISMPSLVIAKRKKISMESLKIMTWGGLRGGISVALALSLPVGTERDIFITMTYIVVVFSILVQGLTIKRLVKKPAEETPGGEGQRDAVDEHRGL